MLILPRISWKSPRWLWVTNKCLCGFCHDAVFLFKKNLWETPPKQPCFLLTPSFSLAPPRSRQPLSFGDAETTSKLLLPCTHGLSAYASNLFPWLQALLGRGCLGNDVPTATSCEGASTTSWKSTPISPLSSHCAGTWGRFCAGHPLGTHLVMPSLSRWSQLHQGHRYKVLQRWPEASMGWRWPVGMRTANAHLGSATRDSGLRKSQSVKTPFCS